jgi:hypothetical protein
MCNNDVVNVLVDGDDLDDDVDDDGGDMVEDILILFDGCEEDTS